MLSGETVPELDIVGCRGNGAAIGRPCHGLHRSGESAIDKNGTFLWLSSTLEKSHRPDLDGLIIASRGDVPAIRGTCKRDDPIGMSMIHTPHFPGRRVPDPHNGIIISSNDRLAVRQPDYGLNPRGVRIMVVDDMLSCVSVPCLYPTIPISHSHARTVR